MTFRAGPVPFRVEELPLYLTDLIPRLEVALERLPQVGRWIPTIQDNSLSDAEGQTYADQQGTYFLYDSLCFFNGRVELTSLGTLTTSQEANIAGFPFYVKSGTENVGTLIGTAGAAFSIAAGASVMGIPRNGGKTFKLRTWDVSTGSSTMTLSKFTGTGALAFSGFYEIETY